MSVLAVMTTAYLWLLIYLGKSLNKKCIQPFLPISAADEVLEHHVHQSTRQNILQFGHNVACTVANEDKLTLCALQSVRSFQYRPASHFDCARFKSPLRLRGQSGRFRESVGTCERASLQYAESSCRWGMPAILCSKCLAPPGTALLQPPGLKKSQLDWDPSPESPQLDNPTK